MGLGDDDTFAGYRDGLLWVGIDLFDPQAEASIGFVRLDVTDSSWTGSWVSSSRGTQPRLEDAYPTEQIHRPIADHAAAVDQAVDWLEAQLRRPVRRYVWRDKGPVVARSWRLDDTGS